MNENNVNETHPLEKLKTYRCSEAQTWPFVGLLLNFSKRSVFVVVRVTRNQVSDSLLPFDCGDTILFQKMKNRCSRIIISHLDAFDCSSFNEGIK